MWREVRTAGRIGSVVINHQYDAAGNTALTYLTLNNGTTSVYDRLTKYTYNADNMVTMVRMFDLSDGLAAGLISGNQFSSSSSSNTVTPLAVTYSYRFRHEEHRSTIPAVCQEAGCCPRIFVAGCFTFINFCRNLSQWPSSPSSAC